MARERLVRWRKTLWVVLASLLVHAVVVALFFLPAAVKQPEPAKEDSVSVELVPPPEEPKPPETPADPPKAEQPPAPPEPPPAPPPPPPPPAEKPPEEKPTPPPPPPPKAPEEKPTPPPPEKPEAPPKDEPPKPDEPKVKTLAPVVQYGDKDAGPKKVDEGNSAEGDAKPDTPPPADAANPPEPDAADAAKPDPTDGPPTPPDAPPVDGPPTAPPQSDAPPPVTPSADAPAGAGPLPPDINLPQADVPDSIAEKNGPASDSPDAAKVNLAPAPPSATPKAETRTAPKAAAKPVKGPPLTNAKTLFSRSETGAASATVAFGETTREGRMTNLCATELTAQIGHALQLYSAPYVLPYRVRTGNVMDVKLTAVRTDDKAYDVSFRCEVDNNATKVVSFAFHIGAIIPRSQWQSRGLPTD